MKGGFRGICPEEPTFLEEIACLHARLWWHRFSTCAGAG
jgi:hypothetical protein